VGTVIRPGCEKVARVGIILLTAAGRGIVTTAAKRRRPGSSCRSGDTVDGTAQPPCVIPAQQVTCHAMTDITGFALGPQLRDGQPPSAVPLCLRPPSCRVKIIPQWLFPGGTFNNQRSYQPHIRSTRWRGDAAPLIYPKAVACSSRFHRQMLILEAL
jgi:hypothetical protein